MLIKANLSKLTLTWTYQHKGERTSRLGGVFWPLPSLFTPGLMSVLFHLRWLLNLFLRKEKLSESRFEPRSPWIQVLYGNQNALRNPGDSRSESRKSVGLDEILSYFLNHALIVVMVFNRIVLFIIIKCFNDINKLKITITFLYNKSLTF